MIPIFISVHDQDLILKLEENNIFRNISDYKYLFLGMRPVDKLTHLGDKVIVARELPDNIEHQQKLLDYTGWYALVKNDLIKHSHVIVVHYDCLLYKNFEKEIEKAFRKNKDYLISFQPYSIITEMKEEFTKTLFKVIQEVYNINSKELIKNAIEEGKIDYPAGGSFACSVEWLNAFINWMEKICPILITDPLAALGTERAMKIFNLIYNVEEKYLPTVMKHIYNLSHDQKYASDDIIQCRRKDFEFFINGDMFNTLHSIKCNKEYLKLLKFTIEQLLLKF